MIKAALQYIRRFICFIFDKKNIEKALQIIAIIFLTIGILVLIYFLAKAKSDGMSISFDNVTDYEITGLFGDYIGGVVGTLFAFVGTILIYLSLTLQVSENSKNKIETHFFEMLRLHRENINELNYLKFSRTGMITLENRQVISEIFKEFKECFNEINNYHHIYDNESILTEDYNSSLCQISDVNSLKVEIIEWAHIDLAYSIVFYGLGKEGKSLIKDMFKNRFNEHYLNRLIFYLRIKPKKSDKKNFQYWTEINTTSQLDLKELIDELYEYKINHKDFNELTNIARAFGMFGTYEKYYGGHQFRLGHYFRHLYQSFKFIHSQPSMSLEERYSYGKMYRAQLSTFEQSLLFVNSISSIGMKWEYLSEKDGKGNPNNLITTYQLIKNIPGDHISSIRFKNYYPNITFESSELPH